MGAGAWWRGFGGIVGFWQQSLALVKTDLQNSAD